MDEIRIELTPEESEKCYGTVAISFAVFEGRVSVMEHWSGMDEIYGDGCRVTIPDRVWGEGLAWLSTARAALATPPAEG